MNNTTSRRHFLSTLGAASMGFSAGISLLQAEAWGAPQPKPGSKIIAFSKAFQKSSPTQTADIVAEVGWDGIDCPVRPKGQIEPERVEEELPRMVEALAKVGREVTMISTDILKVDPQAEKVLRTVSKLGIKRYRMDYWKYDTSRLIPEQIAEVRAANRDLAALNKELGICGGYQNHSGAQYVGAPIWDIYETIKDCDPQYLGTCFDIAHATIEGGLSWPIEARLMRPFFTAVFVKDYVWKKGIKKTKGKTKSASKPVEEWRPEWCPLGEGMVNPEFFQTLMASGYDGPIEQHHEYEVGTGEAMIKAMQKDLAVLKQWLGSAHKERYGI